MPETAAKPASAGGITRKSAFSCEGCRKRKVFSVFLSRIPCCSVRFCFADADGSEYGYRLDVTARHPRAVVAPCDQKSVCIACESVPYGESSSQAVSIYRRC